MLISMLFYDSPYREEVVSWCNFIAFFIVRRCAKRLIDISKGDRVGIYTFFLSRMVNCANHLRTG
jgi:hypothetical protein